MLKYLNYQVYTAEIPSELSLGVSVIGCPIHCPDCHSDHLWDIHDTGYGKELTTHEIDVILKKQSLISCFLFYGGEWDIEYLSSLLKHLKKKYNYKTALYSGNDFSYFEGNPILKLLDFIKVGPYIKELGGLSKKTTNQRLYKLEKGKVIDDMTKLFWRRLS